MRPSDAAPAQELSPLLEGVELDRSFSEQEHDWVQRGDWLECYSCQHVHGHGTQIPLGMMLVGHRGNWKIVPEFPITREVAHVVNTGIKGGTISM